MGVPNGKGETWIYKPLIFEFKVLVFEGVPCGQDTWHSHEKVGLYIVQGLCFEPLLGNCAIYIFPDRVQWAGYFVVASFLAGKGRLFFLHLVGKRFFPQKIQLKF